MDWRMAKVLSAGVSFQSIEEGSSSTSEGSGRENPSSQVIRREVALLPTSPDAMVETTLVGRSAMDPILEMTFTKLFQDRREGHALEASSEFVGMLSRN